MDNSEKKEKIAAIIVTYNRKELLKECLAGVFSQNHPIDKVFVVDNNSTDGTPEFLKENGFFNNELTEYLRLPENIGCSGGFHEGIKKAYEGGYDWFWLMDDDVKMKNDGLKKLLKYKDISLCIHGRKTYLDGSFLNWEDYIDIPSGKSFSSQDSFFYKYNKDFVVINFGCFEGMLMHRNIVKKIGYPDKRFFIKGDDTIYGFLASLYTNVLYANEVIFDKLLKPGNKKIVFGRESGRPSDMIIYYSLRNNFLIEKYFKIIFADNSNRKINHKPYILKMALRMMVSVLIYDRYKFRRMKIILKSLCDGYRMSKNFDLPVSLS